jgi:hypothetical protein
MDKQLKQFFSALARRPETTTAIAEAVGMCQKSVWNYKNGKMLRPSYNAVRKLQAWMDTNPVDQKK